MKLIRHLIPVQFVRLSNNDNQMVVARFEAFTAVKMESAKPSETLICYYNNTRPSLSTPDWVTRTAAVEFGTSWRPALQSDVNWVRSWNKGSSSLRIGMYRDTPSVGRREFPALSLSYDPRGKDFWRECALVGTTRDIPHYSEATIGSAGQRRALLRYGPIQRTLHQRNDR